MATFHQQGQTVGTQINIKTQDFEVKAGQVWKVKLNKKRSWLGEVLTITYVAPDNKYFSCRENTDSWDLQLLEDWYDLTD